MSGHEVLEHTADIGIRAWGATVEEVFVESARALTEIVGIAVADADDEVVVHADGADRAGALVDFLGGLLLLWESEGVGVSTVRIDDMGERTVTATLGVSRARAGSGGNAVKAVTYHALSLSEEPGSCEAIVYLDV